MTTGRINQVARSKARTAGTVSMLLSRTRAQAPLLSGTPWAHSSSEADSTHHNAANTPGYKLARGHRHCCSANNSSCQSSEGFRTAQPMPALLTQRSKQPQTHSGLITLSVSQATRPQPSSSAWAVPEQLPRTEKKAPELRARRPSKNGAHSDPSVEFRHEQIQS